MKKLTTFTYLTYLAFLVSFFLSGCSAITADIKKTWDFAKQKPQDVVFTAEQISEFPYTGMYARVGKGPQAMLVLGFVDQTGNLERLTWLSSGRESVTTEQGRIISTSGLVTGLVGVSELNNDPLRCVLLTVTKDTTTHCPAQWTRHIDMAVHGTETVRSTFAVLGQETIALATGLKPAIKVQEQGEFVFAKQRFTNEFWLAADGHVLKSRQQLTPYSQPIEMTQVKWVGRND